MEIETLIHMANRIGAFFEALPDRQEGLAGVGEHLRRYWDEPMQRDLLAHLDEDASAVTSRRESLTPFVREAIARSRAVLAEPRVGSLA